MPITCTLKPKKSVNRYLHTQHNIYIITGAYQNRCRFCDNTHGSVVLNPNYDRKADEDQPDDCPK